MNDPFSFPVILPRISLTICRKGNRLTAIHNRAAAKSKNDLGSAASCQSGSLHHFSISGIWHDTGKFHYVFSGFYQNLVVDAVFFNGSHSISQHHSIVIFYQADKKFFYTSRSKINFCPVFIDEVIHALKNLPASTF